MGLDARDSKGSRDTEAVDSTVSEATSARVEGRGDVEALVATRGERAGRLGGRAKVGLAADEGLLGARASEGRRGELAKRLSSAEHVDDDVAEGGASDDRDASVGEGISEEAGQASAAARIGGADSSGVGVGARSARRGGDEAGKNGAESVDANADGGDARDEEVDGKADHRSGALSGIENVRDRVDVDQSIAVVEDVGIQVEAQESTEVDLSRSEGGEGGEGGETREHGRVRKGRIS